MKIICALAILLLLAIAAPGTGDGWCEDDTTCAIVFGE